MLGLIKKDLLMVKSNMKVLILLLVIYAVMAYQGQMDLSFLLPFMSVMVMISTFSYDAYNKWDAYAVTLPNGRKNNVRSKYLATLITLIVSSIVVIALSFLISYVRTRVIDYEYILMTTIGCFFATTIIESLMYPAIYKLGVESARIGIFIVIFGIAIIGGIIGKFVDFKSINDTIEYLIDYWMIALPLVMVSILFISYKISERIYMKKEF